MAQWLYKWRGNAYGPFDSIQEASEGRAAKAIEEHDFTRGGNENPTSHLFACHMITKKVLREIARQAEKKSSGTVSETGTVWEG